MGDQLDLFTTEDMSEREGNTNFQKKTLPSNALVLTKKNTSLYKKLNQKIVKLQKEKKRLQAKMDLIRKINLEYNEKVKPLEQVEFQMDEDYVLLLDKFFDKKRLSLKYKELASSEIQSVLDQLVQSGYQSEVTNNLFEKHKKFFYDQLSDEEKAMMQEEFENMSSMFAENLGMDTSFSFDDFLNKSMEDFLVEQQERIIQEMADQAAEEKHELKKERQNFDDGVFKKMYKKLAKVLHPDTKTNIAIGGKKEELIRELSEAWEERNYIKILEINALISTDDMELEFTTEQVKNIEQQLNEELRTIKSNFREISGSFSEETTVFHHFYSRSKKKQAANFLNAQQEIKENIDYKKARNESIFKNISSTKEHLEEIDFIQSMMMGSVGEEFSDEYDDETDWL